MIGKNKEEGGRIEDWEIRSWLGEQNELGISIFNRKYRRDGESLECWLDRVCGGNKRAKELIKEKKFLYGGRVLANRGIENGGNYFNCFSYGYVPDDYSAIMQAAVEIGLTFKGHGGQGLSLSKLRPKGTPIKGNNTSDGIIPFMKIYNEVTAGTSQGGARKGALLISLDALHKEAKDFITIKSQQGLMEKANLSLEINDKFMEAVKYYYSSNVKDVWLEHRNYSGHEIEYEVCPIEIFQALVDNCYEWGDPACLFVNRFRNYNIMELDPEYNIETCNPCGEQPLPKHGACCLSSINLSEFVVNPYTPDAYFDFKSFTKAVWMGVEFLDELIDENADRHPLPEQREMSKNYRNIGLGDFGYATMLMKMGLTYGSAEALRLTDDIFNKQFIAAVRSSVNLAEEKGSFPKYKECVFDSEIMRHHFSDEELESMKKVGLRNCSLISIAPTGSLCQLFNESSGCEPEFAIKYTRKTESLGGDDTEQTFDVYCKAAREYKEEFGTDQLPDCFVGSADIPWLNRVMTQAVMQEHVDTAISSTVNLPETATKDDIANIYLAAWENGLKGITIFRNGCKRAGILTTEQNNAKEEIVSTLGRGEIIKVNDDVIGKKRTLKTGCGSLHSTAFFDIISGDLLETYFSKGSTGGCNSFMIALSRMISLAARAGVSVADIVDQLSSAPVCPSYAVRKASGDYVSQGTSCPSAIGRAIKEMYDDMMDDIESAKEIGDDKMTQTLTDYLSGDAKLEDIANVFAKTYVKCPNCEEDEDLTSAQSVWCCPECKSKVVSVGGCVSCLNCGWSKCD